MSTFFKILGWLLLLLLVVAIAGGAWIYFYQKNVEAIPVALADLEKGGTYTPADRDAILNACNVSASGKLKNAISCECIADKAGTDLSRMERLILAPLLTGESSKLLAVTTGLTKGLIALGQKGGDKLREIKKDDGNKWAKSLLDACEVKKQ